MFLQGMRRTGGGCKAAVAQVQASSQFIDIAEAVQPGSCSSSHLKATEDEPVQAMPGRCFLVSWEAKPS